MEEGDNSEEDSAPSGRSSPAHTCTADAGSLTGRSPQVQPRPQRCHSANRGTRPSGAGKEWRTGPEEEEWGEEEEEVRFLKTGSWRTATQGNRTTSSKNQR